MRVHAIRLDLVCLVTIDRFQMTRSVTIESTDQIRPLGFEYVHHDWYPRFGTICYVPIRSGALLHVHYDPMRSVVIGHEYALNYCPDHDKGDHDLATIGPNMHINSQADSIHLSLKFYRVKTTTHDHQ